MQIIAKCPECGSSWLLDDSAADRRITCRKCGTMFKVPKLDEISKAIDVIEKTKGRVYVDENGDTFA